MTRVKSGKYSGKEYRSQANCLGRKLSIDEQNTYREKTTHPVTVYQDVIFRRN